VTVRSRLAILSAAIVLAAPAGFAQPTTPGPRILAIGDIHGAYAPFVRILATAGLIDAQQKWIGGRATLVQTGDYTDRGADVKQVLDLLMTLEGRAPSGGGQVTTLLGNHEVMNIIGDMRYVTPEICAPFADGQSESRRENAWKQYEAVVAGRRRVRDTLAPVYTQTREAWMAAHPPGWVEYREALGPRGRYGRWLRAKSVAASIGGTLFMHAGINPDQPMTVDMVNKRARDEMARYETYLQRLVSAKMALPFFTLQEVLMVSAAELEAATAIMDAARQKNEPPDLGSFDVPILREALEVTKIDQWAIMSGEGPMWFRGYANWPEDGMARAKVGGFLEKAGLQRIAVGHTPTKDSRITARFNERVFLLDTGMLATVYNGRPAALEIRGTGVSAIYEDGVVPLSPPKAAAIATAR
jgi:hypothetical protein